MSITGPTEPVYRSGWPHSAEVTWEYCGRDVRVTARTETAVWVYVDVVDGQPRWRLVEDDDWIPAKFDANTKTITFWATYRGATAVQVERLP